MPTRARTVAAATLTAVITATITTVGLVPASAAPLDCKAVDEASDRRAIECIPDLRLRAEAASRAASIADERYNQARSASEHAADRAAALGVAARHAERVAEASRARAAVVTASLARGGGSVGQTTDVLLSGDGADEVLYNLSRVSALTEDTTTLAEDAARDSRAAEMLQADARAAAQHATATADEAEAAFDDARDAARDAVTLVQQTEAKRDIADGDKKALEAGWIDLPADASTTAKVLAYARAQSGEPYVFGAAGPGTWDCSGLTMMAFKAAGIEIGGHGATVQYTTAAARGLLVPYSQAQPGDLIFWSSGGTDRYHVAIYSGGGNMIEAPRPGAAVREVPVRTSELVPMAARFTG